MTTTSIHNQLLSIYKILYPRYAEIVLVDHLQQYQLLALGTDVEAEERNSAENICVQATWGSSR